MADKGSEPGNAKGTRSSHKVGVPDLYDGAACDARHLRPREHGDHQYDGPDSLVLPEERKLRNDKGAEEYWQGSEDVA
ncbi:hypothetical protein D9M69_624070 [compost metagenome]